MTEMLTFAYENASPSERREWMRIAVDFAIGFTGAIKCWSCERTIVGSQLVEREWDGHKYRVPVFDCACGESFGNWITEMIEARELHSVILQRLGAQKQHAELATDVARDLGDGIAKIIGYEDPNKSGDGLTAAVQDLTDQLKIARELLWMAFSNGMGYGDDGEMQWNFIDFKRDRMQDIQNTILTRNLEKFRQLGGARFIEKTKLQLEVLQAADILEARRDRQGCVGRELEFYDAVRKLREFNAQQ